MIIDIDTDLEEENLCRRLRGDKDIANDHDLADETKGALGAAEALRQLIPGNTLIIDTDGNRAINKGSSEYGSEGPLRSQIRWGIRSLRKASFGNRSGNGASPNSCDTGTKDGRNKGREKIFGRKFLDFSDQRHPDIGRTRMVHDFMPTERSSRMLSRREEKFINMGAGECSDMSEKSDASKHIRSNIILKLPKDMKGRWASERYGSNKPHPQTKK